MASRDTSVSLTVNLCTYHADAHARHTTYLPLNLLPHIHALSPSHPMLDVWPISCDLDCRLGQIEQELLEMSNVSANKYAQLERSMESLRDNTSSINGRVQEAAHLQATLASLEAKTGAELDQRVLGVLRAAIEPLAMTVAEKLANFEVRINSMTFATDAPSDMATAVEGEEEPA